MNDLSLKINGHLNVCGLKIPHINGGFGKEKKAMLVKHIADIHKRTLKRINELINRNRHRFRNYIDIIDLKGTSFEVVLSDHEIFTKNALNRSNHIYLVSERGYAKLLKLFDDDKSWDLYDQLLDEYFDLREEHHHSNPQKTSSPAELILGLAQQLVHHERKVKELDKRTSKTEHKVVQISNFLTDTPNREKLNRRVLHYARHTGNRNINFAWNEIYTILKAQYGIDVPIRVERARGKIQRDRIAEGKTPYAKTTLEQKVNGLDIVFEEGFENEVNEIVTGLITQVARKG